MSTISRPLFPPAVSLTSAGAAVNTTKAPDTNIVIAGDSLLPQRSRHCSPRLRLRSRAGSARLRRRREPGGTKGAGDVGQMRCRPVPTGGIILARDRGHATRPAFCELPLSSSTDRTGRSGTVVGVAIGDSQPSPFL
jgi:hypothetical protein